MAIINTYPDKIPEDSDKVLGSTAEVGVTKNFPFSDIKDYVDIPTAIKELNGSFVGGDTSVVTVRGDDSLDVQSKRDSADFSYLKISGAITSFADAGGGKVKAYYDSSSIEFEDGDSVTISDTSNYNGVEIV